VTRECNSVKKSPQVEKGAREPNAKRPSQKMPEARNKKKHGLNVKEDRVAPGTGVGTPEYKVTDGPID